MEHSDRARPQVYQFQVQDEDAHSLTFSCVATSVQDAFAIAQKAGFHSVLLMEARDLRPEESASGATRRVLAHPLLGPDWIPIVEAVELITSGLRAGKFWILNTYSALHDYDPYSSPYVQAMQEEDGSLHVEIGGRSQNLGSAGVGQGELLELLGWNAPVDTDPDDVNGHLPNSYRVFEAGWSARAISEFFLESLVVVFGLTTDDLFAVGGDFTTKVSRMIPGLYRLTGKNILSLKPTPDSEDEYDPNFDESKIVPEGYLGEAPAPSFQENEPVTAAAGDPVDFRGKSTSYRSFAGESLVGAIFAGCKISSVSFAGADLTGADFSGAYFEYVDFTKAKLSNARFTNAYGDYGVNFSEADFMGTDLANAKFETAWLIGASMKDANLTNSTFNRCDFHGAIMTGVDCEQATFDHCDFVEAHVANTNLLGAKFIKAYANLSDFSDNDFRSSHLTRCDFGGSTFDRTVLDGMDLSSNDLGGSTFVGASAIETNFQAALGSDQSPMDFTGALLKGADFSYNYISHTEFSQADLTGAFFSDTHLYQVEFREARLEGAYFDGAEIEDCWFDGAEPDTGGDEGED